MKKNLIFLLLFCLNSLVLNSQDNWYKLDLNRYGLSIKFPAYPEAISNPNTSELIYIYTQGKSAFMFTVSEVPVNVKGGNDVYSEGDDVITGFLRSNMYELISKSKIYYRGIKCLEFSFKSNTTNLNGKARVFMKDRKIIMLVYASPSFFHSDFTSFANSLVFY